MRRRSSSRPTIEIELFPFLSILACTIGTLILLIIVMTTQLFDSQREVTILAKTENNEEGKNQSKTPRYIECQKNGIILHPSQEFVKKNDIENSNSALKRLLSEVKQNSNKEYLIVAIRPDGIEVFKKVRDLIEQQGIDIGYEPIDKDWTLKIENPALSNN
jgi:biopolymer transport protein ExbD